MKFQSPFKKQPQAEKSAEEKQPEIETAVVLLQYENGGATVGFMNVSGIKSKRQATMSDMYRMVCEVKQQIENVRVCDRLVAILSQPKPAPIAPVVKEAPNSTGSPESGKV